jgi:nitroreductase
LSNSDLIYKSIISKRDSRQYADEPISDEILRRVLTAGRVVGSAKNSQPARFILIQEPAQKEALAKCGEWTTPLPDAQAVIVVMLPHGSNGFDGGRAAQNMMNAAWAHGITSCPVSVYPDNVVRRVLRHPSDYTASIAIAFSYPRTDIDRSSMGKKIPLDTLVHRETW